VVVDDQVDLVAPAAPVPDRHARGVRPRDRVADDRVHQQQPGGAAERAVGEEHAAAARFAVGRPGGELHDEASGVESGEVLVEGGLGDAELRAEVGRRQQRARGVAERGEQAVELVRLAHAGVAGDPSVQRRIEDPRAVRVLRRDHAGAELAVAGEQRREGAEREVGPQRVPQRVALIVAAKP
jgi:hypothetical protein